MSEYLSPEQEQRVQALLASPMARSEWPTWLMAVLVYGAWFGTIAAAQRIGPWLSTPLLIVCCAWYMSFQHELVHGHPTRLRWFNKILGYAPFAVWFPYTLYLESHLRHHNDANLTLPDVDPETHYVSEKTWQRSGWFMRALYWQRKHFWGRAVFGPAMAIVSVLHGAGREAFKETPGRSQVFLRALGGPGEAMAGGTFNGRHRHLRMWLTHGALTIALLWAVSAWAGIGPLHYLLGVAYPALSLAMVRSYYEHRAAENCKHRIVINEASWPMRLLFLNNNYHLVHHDLPTLPWYLLPTVYWANRDEYLERCGGFRIAGYSELMRRFSFKPVDAPQHPSVTARDSSGSQENAGPPQVFLVVQPPETTALRPVPSCAGSLRAAGLNPLGGPGESQGWGRS